MKRYIPLDEQSFRDISRRKTSLEQDQLLGDDADGMQWLHSGPLDDEVDIDAQTGRRSGICGAGGTEAIIPLATGDEMLDGDVDRDASTRTPELCPCAIGSEVNYSARAATAAPLFSLFRPKKQRKVLVVIRHGESEYNAAARQADNWADPKLYDPSLTVRGCQQARQLRKRLSQELQNNQSILSGQTTVWVTSPLRRCIQTFLLSCPLLPDAPSDRTSATGTQPGVPEQVQQKLDLMKACELPPVRIISCISERVLTYGDIGTQTSELKKEFVPLEECFQLDAEHWWHGGRSNDKENGTFKEKETSSKIKERIAHAKRWLERQPESVIVLYGHSVFWKSFFSHEESMRNCEYRVLHW
eukprot:jgi/Ulvmu1/552/UM001_0560.1